MHLNKNKEVRSPEKKKTTVIQNLYLRRLNPIKRYNLGLDPEPDVSNFNTCA